MATAGHQRSGKGSRVTVEAVNMRVKQYQVDAKGDDLDTTNFESDGYDQGTTGILGCDWSIDGDWDAEINGFTDPPGLYPRPDLGAVALYTNLVDNIGWAFPANRVISSKNGSQVKGLVTFGATCKTQGSGFTTPSGSA